MADYRPQTPFNVPMLLCFMQEITMKGSTKKSYTNGKLIYVSFRSFGGTEKVSNGVLVLEDTAVIETWYRPDLTANCQLRTMDGSATYEILGTPENINMRNQYLRFKVRAIRGGA